MIVNRTHKGIYYTQDGRLTIHFQRQGGSTTINCSHPEFFAEVSCDYQGRWRGEVNYPCDLEKYKTKSGQVFDASYRFGSQQEAIEFCRKAIKRLTGKGVRVHPQIVGYCYTSHPTYEHEKTDRYASPLCYEPETDTIRHSVKNYCVVAFNGGFDWPILNVDKAAAKYRPFVEKALGNGFHDCDRKQGEDHCKRRLAWLAGEYIAEEMPEDPVRWTDYQMVKVSTSL